MGWTYRVRTPKSIEANHGVEFTDSPKNYIEKTGVVSEFLKVKLPYNGPLGAHGSNDGKTSLCGLPVSNAESVESGKVEKVAVRVDCRFCQTRLVNAGILDPDDYRVTAYARDYGRRTPPLWRPAV